MSRKQIILDYNEYLRLEEDRKKLLELRNKLRQCINTDVNPMQISTKALNEIALDTLSFDENGEVYINV